MECSACHAVKAATDFSRKETSKGAWRRCKECTAEKHRKHSLALERPTNRFDEQPGYQIDEFAECGADVPRLIRLVRLRSILGAREQRPACDDPKWPSLFDTQPYCRDQAEPPAIPAEWPERAALAKALVDYGEATDWAQVSWLTWTCEGSGQPSGPPLISDLVEVAQRAAPRYAGSRYTAPSTVNLEALRLL